MTPWGVLNMFNVCILAQLEVIYCPKIDEAFKYSFCHYHLCAYKQYLFVPFLDFYNKQ